MIRLYFDHNVFTSMKRGDFSYISNLIEKYRDNLQISYSSAHISDLKRGFDGSEEKLQLIETDLDYISEITKNHYIYYVHKRGVESTNYKPKDIFEESISDPGIEIGENLIVDIAKLFEEQGQSEKGKLFTYYMNNIPMDETLISAFKNPESADFMNRMFPGFIDNPSWVGWFETIGKLLKNWNEYDQYKEARALINEALNTTGHKYNPDKLFGTDPNNLKDPFSQLSKFFKQFQLPINTEYDEFIGVKNEARKEQVKDYTWFDIITDDYVSLDMFGFRQDKIVAREGKRKNTFANITDDAQHVGYATIYDIFVSNDTHLISKAKAIYKKRNVNTIVCFPHEFPDIFEKLRFKQNNFHETLEYLEKVYLHQPFWEGEIDDILGSYRRIFYPSERIFNYFNLVLQDFYSDLNFVYNTFRRSDNFYENTTTTEELKKLMDDLISFLGNDVTNRGELSQKDIEEIRNNTWEGRKWIITEKTSVYFALNGNLFFDLIIELKLFGQ